MSIWRFARMFDGVAEPHRVSLGEGGTPVVRSRRVGPSIGLKRLYYKLEGCNPTGSYKDRFASAAISHMASIGKSRVVATSSGNTGAALAAYATAARMVCEIAIVEPAPADKLKQMTAYGARIYRVRGFGLDPKVTDAVVKALNQKASAPTAALQISAYLHSPHGMAGVQTIAYELAEQGVREADGLWDHVFVPAGGGGLTWAIARGFAGLVTDGKLARGPRIEVVQPEGNDTMAGPLRRGEARARSVTCTSRISGLQVPTVLDGDHVIADCRASGGTGHVVPDELVWEVQARMAKEDGVFCEPASAVGVAGAILAAQRGELHADARVACVVTGVGFKDATSVDRMIASSPCPTINADEIFDVK